MPTKITIENLRHIGRLEFQLPASGVWLLTGENGTGKTSLLGCIRRLGFKNAFPYHFPASRKSDRLDSCEGATITYEVNGDRVAYVYRTERWVPTPRGNSGLLSRVGYPEVIYIAANADRIEPNKDDFAPRRVRPATRSIIDGANGIFSTRKFDALKTINVRRGVGSQAFLLELSDDAGARRYFSEKNLSLGELCIVKLLRLLDGCRRGSLILIDEIELALHPSAQTELLNFLQRISQEKQLTVIVSTHSSTLIKQAPRKNVLFLQAGTEGVIECIQGCFPSYVLGALALREESASDVVVYVEDDCARVVVEELLRKTVAQVYQDQVLCPSVNVIPVGGFANVLRFFVRQRPLLPAISEPYVVLDGDAREGVAEANAEDIVRIARDEAARISYLPFTPEVGLVDFLHRSRADVLRTLRQHFSLNTLELTANQLPQPPAADAAKPRRECKRIVDQVCDRLAGQLPNASAEDVQVVLFRLLAEDTFQTNRAATLAQFAPLVRR